MKSYITSVAAIALLATTASAGLVKGPCPNVYSLSYNPLMANYIGHHLLYMDQTIYSYLGLAQKIDPSGVPNTTCLNLGSFGYTPKMFQDEFVNQTSALSLKMLYYDVSSGTQVAYDCIDSNKATALINYAQVQLNITIPAAVVKTFASLLKAAHFDVTFVLSDKLKLTNATQTDLISTVQKSLPKFALNTTHAFNMTGCV